ncbi:hypothetical protein JD844_004569 [Phrynosoma platyrhinos]|uniref:General transcription factor IIIC subunit 5 n=1 Tax=Phrynosoma platyrhinos TaxID=52577 RepID=A0ABQ7SDH0_PHRPL|nr:hypothetical protein JD844_004569 [Phrynosoma platyrhinos]
MAAGSGGAGSFSSSSSSSLSEAGASGTAALELQRDRRLVCVEYPGVVRSAEKMLLTLGGEEGVSRLYFRPKDPYCHPVCANRFPTSSMLLKVKKKTRRKQTGVGDWEEEIKFDVEILGIVATVYKFQGMSDFQYLAVHSVPSGKQVSMYDKVLMLKPEKEEFFMSDLPLYIPPPIFSRLDTPVDYYYRPEAQHREGYHNPPLSRENLIGLSRARRPHNAIFVNFEDEEIPTKPLDAAEQTWKRVCGNAVDHRAEEELRKLFEVRPVWSRNAVKANISIHPDKLKFLLPYLAYYMLTGPWRSLWVRFGYDPRKHPEAKIYQVLDFRIRCGMKYGYAPNDMPVKAKRSTYNYSLPITLKKPGMVCEGETDCLCPSVRNVNETVVISEYVLWLFPTPLPDEISRIASHPVGIQDLKQGLSSSGTAAARKTAFSKYKLKDSIYIFREGSLPPYRQMFYQLCDLNVEWYLKHGRGLFTAHRVVILWLLLSALFTSTSSEEAGKEQLTFESGEEEEEEEEEFKPSDGSENEMETEILDYV